MNNIALQLALMGLTSVGPGNTVLFDTTLFETGDISYDDATGVITLSVRGRYAIDWWVATQPARSASGAIFAISVSGGGKVSGCSPFKTGQVSGSAVIEVSSPPAAVTLVNEGAAEFYYAAAPVKASLFVQNGLENLTDGNNTGALRGIGALPKYTMGPYATALGLGTKASAGTAHAEGNATIAEGISTFATGAYAHAEGWKTTAEGNNSHAEGAQCIAWGNSSHAEGINTKASSAYTHAEGNNTTALKEASHAEGNATEATGEASHAEGRETVASGNYAHAEGFDTIAWAETAHAEGNDTTASGTSAHAEGWKTTAAGNNSHAEGAQTTASGVNSHAEGWQSTASGEAAHAEGTSTKAQGNSSHAEGNTTTAFGISSHAEGISTSATGQFSHAEGGGAIASGEAAHAEGNTTSASGNSSHAEGWQTYATGNNSHAEGAQNTAYANASHAEGIGTEATGNNSHAEGLQTSTNGHEGAHIMGKNGSADANYSWFLANGVSPETLGLAAKILANGEGHASAWLTGGADYAELFETEDGGMIEPGFFVTLGTGAKIRKATDADTYILGVSAAVSGYVGDSGELHWKNKYLRGEWGEILYSDAEAPEILGKDGAVLIPARMERRPMLNPAWAPDREYVPRLQRPEWVRVGLLGKLLLRDDGTCVPGGACAPGSSPQ
ncbi:MAG TPA: peptidase G2 autoproteolytic cleavage domain-containing protein [Candidatus Acidoferrum sp.]|nr:peptidase G2 autoproteolytic cleavage domain-containing protein [Candidatus Acidoferrum sp.]